MNNTLKELYELEQNHKKEKEKESPHLIVLKKDEPNRLMEQQIRQTFNKVTKVLKGKKSKNVI